MFAHTLQPAFRMTVLRTPATRARSHYETSTRAEKRVPKQGSDALGEYLNPEGQAKQERAFFSVTSRSPALERSSFAESLLPEGMPLVSDYLHPKPPGGNRRPKGIWESVRKTCQEALRISKASSNSHRHHDSEGLFIIRRRES